MTPEDIERMRPLALLMREETGHTMMDCKKALAACDNDYARAKEYLLAHAHLMGRSRI